MSKIYDKYLELKSNDSNKLYLFKSGKFYIFIADDADTINNYVVLKKVKFTNDTYKCGFPSDVLDDYLRVFNNHNLDIEIIEDFNVNKEELLSNIIKSIDVNKLTPIDALNKLNELKDLVCR